MEQLVLGIFQEHLAKVIIGFRQEQVNANLLNGKGEIKDVSLNCSLFNEAIARVCPYIRMEEIHVSRLGFHVTSYTNLRKAPIIVDIGHVTAKIQEPLSILPRDQRRRIRMVTESELMQLLAEGFKPFRGTGSYGLMDRIVDNLTIEIELFRVEYQTWGKFKTKRPGPWTPPLLQMELKNLKICSVDAEGSEGNPDQVWAHNQGRRDSFLTYKKVAGECKLLMVPQYPNNNPKDRGRQQHELSNLQMEVQIAVERRLQDGAVLACQLDVTIPEVDVDIDSADIHQLAHLASGIQYCLAKDRSFEDPLKSMAESDSAPSSSCSPSVVNLAIVKSASTEALDDSKEDANGGGNSVQVDGSPASSKSDHEIAEDENPSVGNDSSTQNSTAKTPARGRLQRERSVIILPNDLIIYKSVSLTCSIHKLVVWGAYPGNEEEGLEFVAKGCIAEAIWPKIDREQGLYMQISTSFVSIEERDDCHKRVILLAGMQRDDHLSLHLPSRKPQEIHADEFFPLFERRSIRDDPLDLRHLYPTQAFGLKTTVDILSQSNEDGNQDRFMVLHELGADEIEIILDTDVFLRITRFIANVDGEGFDPRWDTGDWSNVLTPDMLRHPSEPLRLDECLQECTELFLDENLMISSDLLNVTARLSNVIMRIPSAIQDSLRSCDIILEWKETTLVISSDLPRTFLTGRIGNSISGDAQRDSEKGIIDFPNDPFDICYRHEKGFTGKDISTFRLQLTTRGFEVNIVPTISFCAAPESQKIVAINDSTTILSFEGEPPAVGCHRTKVTAFLSVLIDKLALNVDFDILAGATCTLLSRKKHVVAIMETARGMFAQSQGAEVTSSEKNEAQSSENTRIEQSLKGRRILTTRHVSQSRETGGLAIIFCLQQKDFRLRVWRQNVPIASPLRNKFESSNTFKYQDDEGMIELLNILDFEMKDVEVGVEFDFHSDSGHRTVLKSCFKQANLRIVDLAKEIEEHKCLCHRPSAKFAQKDEKSKQWHMINLCAFGNESMPCGLNPSGLAQQFAFRLEAHHKNNTQSWSMAVDISAPSTISLDIAAVEASIILITEALLLPTWSNNSITENEALIFPPKTIGAMFCSVIEELLGKQNFSLKNFDSLKIDTNSTDPFFERVLQSMCKTFLPLNLQVILLRCEIANLLISIPSENKDEKEQNDVSILLNQLDGITRFYPIPGSPQSEIEQVLACKGTDWSTLINTNKDGFYQYIFSRQSLLSMIEENEGTKLEMAVHPFEISFTYSGAEVDLSMEKSLLIDDIRLIEKIQSRLKSAVRLSSQCLSDISNVIGGIMHQKTHNSEVLENASKGLKSSGEIFEKRDQSTFSKTWNLLQKLNKEFSLYESSSRNTRQKMDNELETLKISLFKKERERFGALSLMSSRVAGWIRMGGQHRSGQRVMKKSLLWPFWAILRKELLILYPRPGEPKPSDIIALANARIQKLAGGNSKQDTKRGFAIVESSGMVRYFVTANAQEYELWTNGINSAIRLFSDSSRLSDSEDSTDMDTSELSLNEIGNDKGSQRTPGIGNRLSSAFQSARLKGKELSDRRQPSQTIDQSIQDDDEPTLSSDIQRNSELNDVKRKLDQDLPSSKRVEISKKFSEVGLVTKNRFGSAIQNARNKRDEIANRRKTPDILQTTSERNDDSQESLADPLVEEADGNQGPLGPRTGLQLSNKLGSAIKNARMKAKESIEKQGRSQESERQTDPLPNDNKIYSDPTQGSSSSQSSIAALDPSRILTESLQSSIRTRQEENSKRNPRFSFMKRSDSQDDTLSGGEQLTLKNIYAGEDITSLPSASQVELIPLKMLKEKLLVKVSEIADTTSIGGFGSVGEEHSEALTQKPMHDMERINGPSPLESQEHVPCFLIKLLQVQHTQNTASFEKQWSLGEVLKLYSGVSEVIEDMLTQHIGKFSSIWDESSGSHSGELSTKALIEKVMVYGSVLGGLLEAKESFKSIEGFRRYQCEVIESFLNCLLECPLPIDGITMVSRALGINEPIKDFQPTNGDSCGSEMGSPTASLVDDTIKPVELKEGISPSPSGNIFNLLSACEAELQSLEKSKVENGGSQRVKIATNMKASSVTQIQPVFYEPLLPPTLTEHIHDSIHKSLMNVMAQRDEAEAQLIGANVMHTNSLERMRKKNERLEIDAKFSQDIAKAQLQQDLQSSNIASIFGMPDERAKKMQIEIDRKIEKFHDVLRNDDGDAEMEGLCSQLANEITAKTSFALEIVRLKETQEIERKTQLSEKEALQDEIRQLRDLLEVERQKNLTACTEASRWKALYEDYRAKDDDKAL